MRLIGKLLAIGSFIYVGLFVTSCGDDETIFTPVDTTATFDVEIVNDGLTDTTATIVASNFAGMNTVSALIDFTSTDGNMRRIYVTRDEFGTGDEPFDLSEQLNLSNQDVKADGSLDLPNSLRNELKVEFNLPIESSGEGTVIYKFWATSGKGDFRDPTKRVVVGVNTVVINYNGDNPDPAVVSETGITLMAPLADLSSNTFVSTDDGEIYLLSDPENVDFWDFGFYFLNSVGISLASTADYPALFDEDNNSSTALVAIAGLTGQEQSELNVVYFEETSLSDTDFDAISNSSDLDNLTVSASDGQRVNNLAVGDIVAFLDQYGKKGLIEVTAVNASVGTDGSITFDMKVQP
ncbi:MAG: hypothetical protein AAGA66_13400 [Bacteroidota bacterium]